MAKVAERVAVETCVEQGALKEMAAHVAKYSSNIPLILTQVFIESEDGRLYLTCCDGDTWVRRDCVAVGENFKACVNARDFQAKVSALPAGDICLALDKALTISSGKSKYSVFTVEWEDFPQPPETTEAFAPIDPKWADSVAKIVGPCLTNNAKSFSNLQGVNVAKDVASTDKYWIHKIGGFDEFQFGNVSIRPKHAELLDQCDSIYVKGSTLYLKGPGIYIAGPVITQPFLDVNKAIPTEWAKSATFDSADLAEAVKRSAPVASERANRVQLEFLDDECLVTATSSDGTQSFEELIPCSGEDVNGFTIGCNYKVLLECISVLNENATKLCFIDAQRIMTVRGEGDYIGAIAPMAI